MRRDRTTAHLGTGRTLAALSLLAALCGVDASAQGRDTAVAAGPQYAKSGWYRLYFGRDYRDLWTTPVRVPLLDLATHGGGLTPTTAGGGFQTKSLRFRGGDGFQYGFRSVDKDMDVLPPELEGTFIDDIVQDQTSAAHPGAPAVIAPLLEAAGILHTTPTLVVLPDDRRLGEFRERFAGTLGFIERRAIKEEGRPGFAGADEIIEGIEVFGLVQRGPQDRVDTRAFLTARLFDLWIGDWDRHQGQWGWARFGSHPVNAWVPIPEDRDQAFVRFDGIMMWLARQYAPQLVNFGERYPGMEGLTWNGRELDRRFLVGLEWPTWDSTRAALQARLTDAVIEEAVRQLPRDYYALDGDRLTRTLKRRRDRLPEAARRFYRHLARQVDIHGTDREETVLVDRHADGTVEVAIRSGPGAGVPYLRRRFHPDETSELRIYLHEGRDRVVLRGPGRGMRFHVVGSGDDVVADSSSGGGVRLYATGSDRAVGPSRVAVDRRPYVPPPRRRPTEQPPRDWGHWWRYVLWLGGGPDVGVFVGGGALRMGYGFRKLPYASAVQLRAGVSSGARTGRFDLSAEFYRANSRMRTRVDLLVSGIETLRFYGLGNKVEAPLPDDFYRVSQRQVSFDPRVVLPVAPAAEFAVGPTAVFYDTRRQAGRIVAATEPYGSGTFGEIGLRGDLTLDTRDDVSWPTAGLYARLGGAIFPPMWDVDSTFGEAHGEVRTYLTARRAPLRPTLALRVGGKKVWGKYPFQEAAFIGEATTVRLGRQNRFGGDAAVWSNAELRLTLSRFFFLLPGEIGVFGLGDVGRVFVTGESSDDWHWAAGGGLWTSFVGRRMTVSVAVAKSEERTALYFGSGFAY